MISKEENKWWWHHEWKVQWGVVRRGEVHWRFVKGRAVMVRQGAYGVVFGGRGVI